LLRAVADSFQNLSAFRVEGHVSQELDTNDHIAFRVAGRSRQLYIEVTGGEDWMTGLPYTAICDGGSGWAYYKKSKSYQKVSPDDWNRGYCTPGSLTGFEHVADNVRSARITGTSQVEFEGHVQPCVVVEAVYRVINEVMVVPGITGKIGRVSRTLCIDEVRKLILTDRLEADLDGNEHPPHLVESVSYDRIERNPNLPAALFEFHAPEGATEMRPPEPPKTIAQNSPSPGPYDHKPANPLSLEKPEYSQEAWDEGIQGRVVLLVDVGAEGGIRKVTVQNSLGWGLDEKAIETVRKARFEPATNGGQPVDGGASIQIEFSLPDKRPAQASVGPINRTAAPVRLPQVELEVPTDLDYFFFVVAVNFKAPEVCPKINAMARGSGWSRRGYEVSVLQSECYSELATLLHQARLCDHVRPVRVEGLDGSGFDKAYCLTQLHGGTISVPFQMEPFARIMQSMGYGDADVKPFVARLDACKAADPEALSEVYWEFVSNMKYRGSARDRAEFLRRVMSLK
jgi:TonB family protein